jgi:pyruvate/2-oxoglutarate dehydrogenase complex dihydrolipoamide acyltransferase (E2) component
MEPQFEYLHMPREAAGDDRATLLEWTVDDGARVEAGSAVCTVETSKASVEIEVPRAGWLFHMCDVNHEVAVGQPVGMIADSPERPSPRKRAPATDSDRKITRKAQQLIDEFGVRLDAFEGVAIVRERDVRLVVDAGAAAAPRGPESEALAISAIQSRVAETVSRSHAEIPHSYLARWLPADQCGERLRLLSEPAGISASLADLLVYGAARAAQAVPKANAAWNQSEIRRYLAINVGFALNLPNGDLVVPVIPEADTLAFETIVASIRGHQVKARRNKLAPTDLQGGTLTVTSLIGTGVQQVSPIIVPGQSTILAIGDPLDGAEGASHCLTLGFDHRVLNGAEAAQYLARVAEIMTEGEPQ